MLVDSRGSSRLLDGGLTPAHEIPTTGSETTFPMGGRGRSKRRVVKAGRTDFVFRGVGGGVDGPKSRGKDLQS